MCTYSLADEVEAVIGCWACQCCVKILELARSEFAIGAGGERIIVPVKRLKKYVIRKKLYSHVIVLHGGLRRRPQFPRKVLGR